MFNPFKKFQVLRALGVLTTSPHRIHKFETGGMLTITMLNEEFDNIYMLLDEIVKQIEEKGGEKE